jgi:ubiquinone/menaquinone biosynthesis C-methylase UbiE
MKRNAAVGLFTKPSILGRQMIDKQTVLTSSEARAYYDRFGKKQDSQGFYEDPALDDLIAHAGFNHARKVFEFGCGTGKLAARLLAEHLPSSATYLGCDVSPVMVGIATRRLEAYPDRARVVQSDGVVRFPLPDHSVDRVISSYVLDLLSEGDIRMVFAEAQRVLTPSGKLCLVSLTKGITLPSRIVSSVWMTVFRMRASLVGGCRPIRLDMYIDGDHWQLEYRRVVTPFGVPSEVLVLSTRNAPERAIEPTA